MSLQLIPKTQAPTDNLLHAQERAFESLIVTMNTPGGGRAPRHRMIQNMLTELGVLSRNLREIPYFHSIRQVETDGIGRKVHHLFAAMQLLAEWRDEPTSGTTEADVIAAFDLAMASSTNDAAIFPGGNVHPAVKRLIVEGQRHRPEGTSKMSIRLMHPNPKIEIDLPGNASPITDTVPPIVRLNPQTFVWEIFPH